MPELCKWDPEGQREMEMIDHSGVEMALAPVLTTVATVRQSSRRNDSITYFFFFKYDLCEYVIVHTNFSTQSTHSPDRSGWQAKMASIPSTGRDFSDVTKNGAASLTARVYKGMGGHGTRWLANFDRVCGKFSCLGEKLSITARKRTSWRFHRDLARWFATKKGRLAAWIYTLVGNLGRKEAARRSEDSIFGFCDVELCKGSSFVFVDPGEPPALDRRSCRCQR